MKEKIRRSNIKKITKECRILKFMRESRGLSMRKAAKIIGTSDATINHLENGRMGLTDRWIFKVISGYGYKYEDFQDYLENRARLPDETLKDCITLLSSFRPEKIIAVYIILKNLK